MLFEQKQILLHLFTDRLAVDQQGAADSQPVAENRRCQPVVGADPAEGDHMASVSFASVGQDKLQLSDFVAAVHRATLIIAFDPKVFATQLPQWMDGRGEGSQRNPG